MIGQDFFIPAQARINRASLTGNHLLGTITTGGKPGKRKFRVKFSMVHPWKVLVHPEILLRCLFFFKLENI
jgi:hypothetical protein